MRIDPELHSALREAALHSGVSLNDYCQQRLALPQGALPRPAVDAVRRAAVVFGEQLLGVVAFGSWARDQLSQSSDIDLLIVVEWGAAITRSLYRSWDAKPLVWDSHPVEPHFLRFPESGARVSGIWAEAAVDGIVLFDRDLRVSKHLVEIRRRIVAGEIVRRRAHGQPYWVEAA